jgi:hypothetical protein
MAHQLRITPRARAIYAQLAKTTNPKERAALSCALHGAVGLQPWSDISVSEVLAEFDMSTLELISAGRTQ